MGISAFRRVLADGRGQLLPLYATLLPIVVLVVAILVDLGFILMQRLELQQMAAGAAAAGAEYYDEGRFRGSLDVTLDRGAAEAAARAQMEANLRRIPNAGYTVLSTERDISVEAWRIFRPWWWSVSEFTVRVSEAAAPLGSR